MYFIYLSLICIENTNVVFCVCFTLLRSDAESVATTISQDSRGSNKENKSSHDTDDEVILRRKPEYTKVFNLLNFRIAHKT